MRSSSPVRSGALLILATMLGCSLGAGSRTPPAPTPTKLAESWRPPSFAACVHAATEDERLSLTVSYRSREPKNDVPRMGREADRVFECIRHEVEERGIPRIYLWSTHLAPDFSEGSMGFSYRRQEDGTWEGSKRFEGLGELRNAGDGPPLSMEDLEQVRGAVSAIPDLGPFAGLRSLDICVEADTGLRPNRVRFSYSDDLFWRGIREQFDDVASALEREAARARIREVTITVRNGEQSQMFRLLREQDGSWPEPVAVEVELQAEPEPSGSTAVSLKACVLPLPGDGRLSLWVSYRSRLPRNGVSNLAPEAHRVFNVVGKEAERRGLAIVIVSPMDARGVSSGLAYYRQDDGSWQRPFPGRAQDEVPDLAEGPPLTREELEQIRLGVEAVPDLSRSGEMAQATPCAVGEKEMIPDQVTVEYEDPTYWKGERHRFEALASAL